MMPCEEVDLQRMSFLKDKFSGQSKGFDFADV
jgi:hypothetical protein